jgi:hypothetical protein
MSASAAPSRPRPLISPFLGFSFFLCALFIKAFPINKVKAITDDQDRACHMSDSEEKEALLDDISSRMDILTRLRKEESVGLRLDNWLKDPHTGEELWVDTSCCHPSASRSRGAEFAHTIRRLTAVDEEEVKSLQPSPALVDCHNGKLENYALMLAIARRQTRDGRRAKVPTMTPVVLTTSGERAEGTEFLTEWLVGKYRADQVRKGERNDGREVKHLVADFRFRLKLSLLFAIIKGQAEQLLCAGLPFTNHRRQSPFLSLTSVPSSSSSSSSSEAS